MTPRAPDSLNRGSIRGLNSHPEKGKAPVLQPALSENYWEPNYETAGGGMLNLSLTLDV
jgi:hypothetical protein